MNSHSSNTGPVLATHERFADSDEPVTDMSRMSILDHLDEFRRRLLYSIYAVLGCAVVTFWYWEPMYRFLIRYFQANLQGGEIIYSRPTAGFMLSLQISVLSAAIIASPFVFSQLWMFVAPGLYAREKRFAIPFIVFSSLFFAGGAAFAHFVAYPLMWQFFASYQLEGMKFLPTLDLAFGFYVKLIIALGLVFEMPMLVFVLARFGMVTAGFLIRYMKYAILAIFILAAIATPTPDVVTQAVFAAPMFVLYLISIGVAWLFGKKKKTTDVGP